MQLAAFCCSHGCYLVDATSKEKELPYVLDPADTGCKSTIPPYFPNRCTESPTSTTENITLKSSLFSSDGSVPVKTAERNEATVSAQTSYTTVRKVFGSSAGLSSAPSLPVSPNKPAGSSFAGFGAGNHIVLITPCGSPPPQQTIGNSHNNRAHTSSDSRYFKSGTMFDTKQTLSKNFYSVRSTKMF